MLEYQQFHDLYKWICFEGNPTFSYFNAFAPVNLCLYLLTNKNTEIVNFLNDTNEDKSLLAYISNDDPVLMLANQKSIYDTYGVYIF